MAALTYQEIQTRVANHLRIPTSDTTQMTRVQAIINEVYRDLVAKNPTWYWLRKRQIINTATAFEDGTASVTPGVTLVTLTASPSAAFGSFANRVFTVPANAEDPNAVYRVATHVAGEGTPLPHAGSPGPPPAPPPPPRGGGRPPPPPPRGGPGGPRGPPPPPPHPGGGRPPGGRP